MTEDETMTGKDKAMTKGYLGRWNVPLLLALFIDILTIPSILSLKFQETIDPMQSVRALKKAKERSV